MKLSEIKIKGNFLRTPPADYKLNACRDFCRSNGCVDRDIILNKNNVLVDGYVAYLVLKENNISDTEVIYNYNKIDSVPIEKLYVYARHAGNSKEYVWRIKARDYGNISVGDNILVNTKFGNKVVTVTRIEKLFNPPVAAPIRKVLKCIK